MIPGGMDPAVLPNGTCGKSARENYPRLRCWFRVTVVVTVSVSCKKPCAGIQGYQNGIRRVATHHYSGFQPLQDSITTSSVSHRRKHEMSWSCISGREQNDYPSPRCVTSFSFSLTAVGYVRMSLLKFRFCGCLDECIVINAVAFTPVEFRFERVSVPGAQRKYNAMPGSWVLASERPMCRLC